MNLSGYYNLDCMKGMKEIPDKYFDLAIVDPPYRDEEENDANQCGRYYNGSRKKFISGGKPGPEYFKELYRVSKNQIIWGANNFSGLIPPFKGFIVWRKLSISENFNMSMAEIASLSEGLGTISKVYEQAPQGTQKEKRIHPTQKPVSLYKWILANYSKAGDMILDTHAGSASCLIACEDIGRKYLAFEIDREYYKASVKRLEDFNSQLRMKL